MGENIYAIDSYSGKVDAYDGAEHDLVWICDSGIEAGPAVLRCVKGQIVRSCCVIVVLYLILRFGKNDASEFWNMQGLGCYCS